MPFSKTTDEDIKQLVAPVYLGWADLGQDPDFREDAERIFHVVKTEKNGKYLYEKFEDNLFYHPYYLMGQGKNQPKSQQQSELLQINAPRSAAAPVRPGTAAIYFSILYYSFFPARWQGEIVRGGESGKNCCINHQTRV